MFALVKQYWFYVMLVYVVFVYACLLFGHLLVEVGDEQVDHADHAVALLGLL